MSLSLEAKPKGKGNVVGEKMKAVCVLVCVWLVYVLRVPHVCILIMLHLFCAFIYYNS